MIDLFSLISNEYALIISMMMSALTIVKSFYKQSSERAPHKNVVFFLASSDCMISYLFLPSKFLENYLNT
jgi:hypothetical protein